MRVVCILVVFLSLSNAESISSSLTDGENKTSTSLETKDQEWNDLSILRQMINQETVIRLALVKNVHALVNDVTLMKKSLAASETRVTGQQQTIDALKIQVDSLQQENNELKNSSRINEARIMELETKLQSVNENFNTMHDELNVIQKDSDDKRQEMFNKTHSVLDDIKIEVRYLSVTLLDFKEHTEIENESRDKKYEELERYFNSSYEDFRVELSQIKYDSTNRKVLIQNLEDSQTEIRRNLPEKLNRTVAKFETQLKTLEYEQLKLSSAVASLEVANMNLSKQNCDKSNHHAFSAGISSSNSGWSGSTLVFPVVIYSEGTGYNPSTGIFTAPTAGTYVFYISVQSENRKYIRLDIVLNGSSKINAMAWFSSGSGFFIYQTGTNLVILHLLTGDKVWVKRYDGTGYFSHSTPVTTFSGFKVY